MGMALRQETSMGQDYQKMPIKDLKALARQQHPDHDPEAARAFVDRVLDMEVERRTWYAHENQGYQPFSSASKLGENPGGGTAAADPLAMAYDRGIRVHASHEWAKEWIDQARIKPRGLLALLIQSAKMHPRQSPQATPWCKSYDQIAQKLPTYAQLLGFPPGVVAIAHYGKGQAIKRAAHQARCELILLAKL